MVTELVQGTRRKLTWTGDDRANKEEKDKGDSENENIKHESENFGDEPKHEVPDVKIETDVEQQFRPLMTETLKNSANMQAFIIENTSADNVNDDFMDPNLMERVNLLEKAPIYLSMTQFLDGFDLGREDVDNLLLSTLEEVETRNRNSNEPLDLKSYTPQQLIFENESTEKYENCSTGTNSLIASMSGPYMSLTKNNCIKNLADRTQRILKSCCPVSLYQARIGNFMGTLSLEDMLKVFTLSRRTQNFVHYNKMKNVPYFTELTTRYR